MNKKENNIVGVDGRKATTSNVYGFSLKKLKGLRVNIYKNYNNGFCVFYTLS